MLRGPTVLVFAFSACLDILSATTLEAQSPTLGRYISSSVQMYGAFRSTPAAKRLAKPLEDALERFVESGVFRDMFDLATIELAESDRREIGQVIRKVLDLLGGPNWKDMLSGEVAFGMSVVGLPAQILVFRIAPDHLARRHDEVHKMLEGFAGFAPESIYVTKTQDEGATISTLRVEGIPYSLSAVSKKDAMAMIVSAHRGLQNSFIELVGSEDAADSIATSEKFLASQSGLPEDAYAHFFFDVEQYLGQIEGLLSMATMAADGNNVAQGGISLVRDIIAEFRKLRLVGSTESARGDQVVIDELVSIKKSETPGFIERLIAEQEPIAADYLKVVPKDARSFFLTAGVKPLTIYDKIIERIGSFGEDGKDALAAWRAVQDRIGVDVREDLLSWIDGGGGLVHLPGEHLTGDCVAFIRVTDTEKARALLKRAWEPIHRYVTQKRGQQMELVDVPELDQFQELRIPAMPWMRPVIGTPSGVLVLATSREAAWKVAAAVSGGAESIRSAPRFQALGIPETGSFAGVWYADVEHSLEGLANVLGAGGFFLSLIPEDEDTKPAVKFGHILTKVATLLRDLDIAVDTGGWSSYDPERHEIRSRAATTLRLDPTSSAPPGGEENKSSEKSF